MVNDVSISAEARDARLQAWFAPVLSHGSRWCAPNLETTCAFLRAGDVELPLTVNESQWDNSWVCSPYTHYVSYAREEIRSAVPGLLSWPATGLLRLVGGWLRTAQFNRVVMVNNWLMSTNPWPEVGEATARKLIEALRTRWPDHALVFRSLNERSDTICLEALARHGARLIPSRQVWWFAPDSAAVARARAWRKDMRLVQRSDLDRIEHDDLCAEDFPRLASLYHELYLGKYSRHNPAYTADWLRHLWRQNLLRFSALRQPGGALVGVEACGILHGTMVSPIVGYAVGLPQDLGLYRRLAAVPVMAARREGAPLNLSAGVGGFKALRGGEPVMEYLAVVDGHLAPRRRIPWRAIEALSRGVLAPVARRKRL